MRSTAREELLSFAGSGGRTLRALLVAPDPAPEAELPGVVLVPSGAAAPERERAREAALRLAGEGFAALVPELDAALDPESDEGGSDRRLLADLDRAAAALGDRHRVDRRRLAAVGLGAGGTLAFLFGCTSTRLAAVVMLGGPIEVGELSERRPARPLELALNLEAPLLAVFRADDPPREHVERMRAALAQGAKRFEIEVLPAGEEATSAAAWRRATAFLREHLEA